MKKLILALSALSTAATAALPPRITCESAPRDLAITERTLAQLAPDPRNDRKRAELEQAIADILAFMATC